MSSRFLWGDSWWDRRILTEICFKQRFQIFLVLILNFSLQRIPADWVLNLTLSGVRALIGFFQNIRVFFIPETVNVLFQPSQEFNYPFVLKCSFKASGKRENVEILSTTPSHWTLMANSVQWLSQSDCSFCISAQVEFY